MPLNIFGPGMVDAALKPQNITRLVGTPALNASASSDRVTDGELQRDRNNPLGQLPTGRSGHFGHARQVKGLKAYQDNQSSAASLAPVLSVEDIMATDVPVVLPLLQIEDALALMARYNIPFMPVVDLSERPLGVLNELAIRRLPDLASRLRSPVQEVMEKDFFLLRASASLHTLGYLLGQAHAECVCIENEQDQLVGLVLPKDYLSRVTAKHAEEVQG